MASLPSTLVQPAAVRGLSVVLRSSSVSLALFASDAWPCNRATPVFTIFKTKKLSKTIFTNSKALSGLVSAL